MQTPTSNIHAWLQLSQLSSLKPQQWLQLCERFSCTVEHLCKLPDAEWAHIGISSAIIDKRARCAKQADKAMEWLQNEIDVQCISFECAQYPEVLRELSHPPAVLFVKGQAEVLNQQQVAIVGSRHASPNGQSITQELAKQLAANDIVVTSGLARGIDSCAHRGALLGGKTLAVLGCGIDICYPKYNQNLYRDIVSQGSTLISEFLPGTAPRAHHFPQRNRIVAALSDGVLVVEAKIRSGSLITANLAADMGKEVFAVPGNINHPLSEGVNWLIQQGAKLVTNYTDILDELGILVLEKEKSNSVKKPLARDPILDSVDYDVTSLANITKRSKLSSQAVLTALLEYELRGLVAAVPGGYLKLRGK